MLTFAASEISAHVRRESMSDTNQTEDKPAAQAAEREPETDMTAAEEVGFSARRKINNGP
jgi:hypothetical protein